MAVGRVFRTLETHRLATSADTLTHGHALVQNLRNGFSMLTASVPRSLRLMIAWQELVQTMELVTAAARHCQLPKLDPIYVTCPLNRNRTSLGELQWRGVLHLITGTTSVLAALTPLHR